MWDRLPSNRRSAIETRRVCEIIPTSKSVTDKQANKMFGLVCNGGFRITAIKTIAFKKTVKGKERELTIMTVKRNP